MHAAHDLRIELRRLAARVGPNVTLDRFCRELGIAPGTVAHCWGSWTKLRVAAGLPPRPTSGRLERDVRRLRWRRRQRQFRTAAAVLAWVAVAVGACGLQFCPEHRTIAAEVAESSLVAGMREMSKSFRSRLAGGETLFGTMLTLPNASVAEILADAGYDWLFVDGEHGPLETHDILAILQAVGHRVACLVRVAAAGEAAIKTVLDLGADGIIVPQVNSAEEAARIVQWARYAPQGARGVGLARAHGYGKRFQEYVASANERTVVVVQAEHIRAVENIESIVKVTGIDAVLLGPYDLSASLNKLGQIDDPEVVAAIDRVTEVCQAARIPLGYFGVTAAAVQPFIDRGYTLITAGVDTLFLAQSASQMLKQLRPR